VTKRPLWGVSVRYPILAPSCITENGELWAAVGGKVLVSTAKRSMLVIAGSAAGGEPKICQYNGERETIDIMKTDWRKILDQVR
jgi:hypothetical protein